MANQTPLPIKVNFTDLSYDDLVAEIKTRIPFVIPEWRDFLDSNVGIGILRLVAYLVSIQTFYTDRQAAECFIDTALIPENIYRLAKLVGFHPRGYFSAEGVARFTLPEGPHSQDIVIPEGTTISSSSVNLVPFSTVEPTLIPLGETKVDVRIIQGIRSTESFIANGEKHQKFQLASKTAAFNSFYVTANSNILTEVSTFVGQSAVSLCFIITKDHLDNVFVEFGDGREGFIPGNGVEIEVAYHDSVGTVSELPPGVVTVLGTTMVDVLNAPVLVNVTNPDAISGGALPETPDDVKIFAPGTFKTQERSVTKSDYLVDAERFAGVAEAQILDTTDDDSIPLGHVHIYVVGKNGISVDTNFLTSLRSTFARRSVTTIRPRTFAVVRIPVNVSLTINYFSSFNPQTVRANVIKAIRDYLTPSIHPEQRALAGLTTHGIKIGQDIFASQFSALALAVPGVYSVTQAAPIADTEVEIGKIATAGTITIALGQAF